MKLHEITNTNPQPSDGDFLTGQLDGESHGSLEGCPTSVSRDFACWGEKLLTSLKFGPITVGRDFICGNNPSLTSLEFAPTTVGRDFIGNNNPSLTSLEGCPTSIGRNIYVNDSDLRTLEHSPRHVTGNFDCSNNRNLSSLKGAPERVDGMFSCRSCELTSLDGVSAHMMSINASGNNLTNLHMIHKQIKSMDGGFIAFGNKNLESNLLGLILIDGVRGISLNNNSIEIILNKYLCQSNKKLAMLQCQQELIEAGFAEAAQL